MSEFFHSNPIPSLKYLYEAATTCETEEQCFSMEVATENKSATQDCWRREKDTKEKRKEVHLMFYVLRYLLGFAALCAAVYFFYKTITKKSAIKACNGHKVDATVVDYTVQALGNGIIYYYPIYEYQFDGEDRRYTSAVPLIKPVRVGATIKLHYNKSTSEVVDQTNAVANTTVAILCGGIAVILFGI